MGQGEAVETAEGEYPVGPGASRVGWEVARGVAAEGPSWQMPRGDSLELGLA
jgi:hypothetical protein